VFEGIVTWAIKSQGLVVFLWLGKSKMLTKEIVFVMFLTT
jgi:hypothetical protein